ncbi:unnamed protein product [Brassica oleracea]|uniref:E3 ubiquitin-protein ligase RMA n=1 Tax=Brassica oleracea TaxID=3712 RepID=A0A3P6AK45_BRAOL|nr:unnamed protein product [Brassica oleracea]
MEEVNLDLNFGPEPEASLEPATSNVAAGLSDVANEPFNRDSESLRRLRTRLRSSFRRNNSLPALAEFRNPMIESSQLIISSANGAALTAGGERDSEEDSNKCENGSKVMEEEDCVREEKSVGSKGSFYDCYICMDLSKEPVVTNCGHLYCWPCLYRWLEVSVAKECPVCKGEISVKTLTPIYGRGGKIKTESEEVSDTTNKKKIPSRPQARRVERVRRSTLQRPGYVGSEIINRFMTSRRVRAEHNQSSAAVVAPVYEEGSETMSAMSIWREMLRGRTARNQERNNVASVEDRESVSSILGVMNSESQADTAAEIDSMVTVSSSSVGRPHENEQRVALAEWLRRVPAKYMGFSRESSNLSGDEVFFITLIRIQKTARLLLKTHVMYRNISLYSRNCDLY